MFVFDAFLYHQINLQENKKLQHCTTRWFNTNNLNNNVSSDTLIWTKEF